MPRIWMDYCELMILQRYITATRRVFDRALRALPVTQHDRIWPLYIKFVTSHKIPETTMRIYRRLLFSLSLKCVFCLFLRLVLFFFSLLHECLLKYSGETVV